jgi:hydroxymethylbilane synthase
VRRPRRAATRGSTLALTQTRLVADLLGVDVEVVVVETTGDRQADAPITSIGGQGVFVKEVQAAVLDGRADIAVHSAKDLQSAATPGLVIGAVPPREDARDALVGAPLDALPAGARVATGSVRRRAQLAWLRPDLTFAGLRGNMETRLAKAAGFDAIVVAAAALRRLGRADRIAEVLEPGVVLPQVSQGALAVECREDDAATLALLATVDHRPSRRAVEAERAFLREVGGSCDLPVGAYATTELPARANGGHGPSKREQNIHLEAMIATGDGRVVLRHRDEGPDPEDLGRRVARYLLDDAGGTMLLGAAAGL